MNEDLAETVRAVRARETRIPELALILGSGLGDLALASEDRTEIPTAELPAYPRSTVAGHSGRLVFGKLEGRMLLFIQGRVHVYEGHSPEAVAFPVRLVHALGAPRLLVTNAAGGINPSFEPGTLMFITGHIGLPGASGPGADQARIARGAPFAEAPAFVSPYDSAWLEAAEQAALRRNLRTRRGVYLWTRGPSYETKAEIRFFERMGADAVGMSTVPEVLQARQLGMAVLGLSAITNAAAGLQPTPLSHAEVLAAGARLRGALETLVRGIVRELGAG